MGFLVNENFNVEDTVPLCESAIHTRRPGREENTLVSCTFAGSIESGLMLVKKHAP